MLKMIIIQHLFKNALQYQMAKFNNAKPQLLLYQPNRKSILSIC